MKDEDDDFEILDVQVDSLRSQRDWTVKAVIAGEEVVLKVDTGS